MGQATKIGLVFLGLILFSFGSAFPQIESSSAKSQTDESLLGVKSKAKSFSLLDPSKFRMSHSYTLSYFSSGKTSGSFGVYTNVLEYKFSNPLTLTLSLNFLHRPLSVFRKDQLRTKDAILPNFQLRYRPNDSFSFTINVLTFPSPYHRESPSFWPR
ncbi:MAG: hypothetical protein ACE5KJ_02860 [Candidatus Zixiibacteriota bacterium]